jgi:NAD(P)-dependent dehydrogenase (short-subunit alcohol dehydrogenase family)
MMKQRFGRILNCTSKAWAGDNLRHAHYAAANAAVVGLTRGVATEVWPYGITCNAFAPFARTRAGFELVAYRMAEPDKNSPYVGGMELPLEFMPSPDYCGPMIVYLASDAATKISGSVFNIGGNGVGIYEEPDIKRTITKFGEGPWTIEELKAQLPRSVLMGYKPHIQVP